MSYLLKQYDVDLLKFDMQREINEISVEILSINENVRSLLPLDLELSNRGLASWLKHRIIPTNRAYVQNFLSKLGLNERDTKGIIDICKGLSLNDCYWVVDEDFSGNFEENNLYNNRLNNILGLLAFTGVGSAPRTSLRSSPEFTTNGMLAKCWRRVDGKITLFKSGTQGFANSGNEPYAEFYSSQIADKMGIDAVNYNLSKWKGYLCSTCELFTSLDYSFIPIGRLVKSDKMVDVIEYYKSLGDKFYEAFVDMIVFDAVILNTDRHFGNFGLLIDNKTNKIYSPAPLFDHGLSLLNYAMPDELENIEKYAETRHPIGYNNFIDFAKQLIGPSQKEKLRKLINFQFKKHPRYNWSNSRLKAIEKLIQSRVRKLLE